MSETLKTGAGEGAATEWDDMAKSVDIDKRLDAEETPESILEKAYENGDLTPDFIDANSSTLLEHGLNEDKLEYYEKLAREQDGSPEARRRRFDEEPEQSGFETKAA